MLMPEIEQLPSETIDDWWITVQAPERASGADGAAGKWLVFVPVRYVDHFWKIISQAVLEGKLGPSAEVATARPNPHQTDPTRRVIVVYTADWTDEDDVRRVLRELRELGITWRITYKTDDDTTRGVYGRHAATYISQSNTVQFTTRKQDPQPSSAAAKTS
ncbi:putative phosphothreonine lyase domain-containg protein [Actinoplanes solisilvae]|uniref:putative phosphothreonine lyase domain-containing protein n=1 Tax=Actinoplanes solisilvae TaxID=2486853 RepID=UPI0013E29EFE|nr:putative phosphothreonine lyase domain-containg protein [Actinoplanes solisilvae]